jgi:hypothetical protein
MLRHAAQKDAEACSDLTFVECPVPFEPAVFADLLPIDHQDRLYV